MMTKTARGFTLLEMLIALAILASALTVLMGTMANSGQQVIFSGDLTTATLLARSKMIDIEYEIMEEGFSDMDQAYNGDFAEEGRPDITWKATVSPVEIPPEAREQFLAQINDKLFGQNSDSLKGNAAFSAMLPTLIGQMPEMINNIGAKVRKVELTVEFPYGAGMHPVDVVQYIADPDTSEFNVFGETETDEEDE